MATIEEHLLICPACQDHLDKVDEYIQIMKLAASAPPGQRGWLSTLSRRPYAARLGIAAVIVVALVLVIPWQGSNAPRREVTLETSRGVSTIPMAEARAGGALSLRMDIAEIVRFGEYEVSVVNSEGREVCRMRAQAVQNQLAIAVPIKMSAGTYWVRLFDTSSPPTLLREYGLHLP